MDRESLALIVGYVSHMGEPRHFEAAIERLGAARLVATTDRMARHCICRGRLLFFLQDAFTLAGCDEAIRFRSEFLGSTGKHYLQRQLTSSADIFFRAQLIHLVSKTGWPDAADLLISLVPSIASSDPLLLPDLLFEIGWSLGPQREQLQPVLSHLIEHPLWLTRWALVAHYCEIRPAVGQPLPARDQDRLHQLADDRSSVVAAHARHYLDGLALAARAELLSKQPRRSEAKALSRKEPWPSFRDLSIRFHNQLHNQRRKVYDIDELEAFYASISDPARNPAAPAGQKAPLSGR